VRMDSATRAAARSVRVAQFLADTSISAVEAGVVRQAARVSQWSGMHPSQADRAPVIGTVGFPGAGGVRSSSW